MLSGGSVSQEFPPLNVWTSQDGAIVRAEIPGIDPNDVDISLVNDTLTIKGSRKPDALEEGEGCHRQERGYGQFTRSHQLRREEAFAEYTPFSSLQQDMNRVFDSLFHSFETGLPASFEESSSLFHPHVDITENENELRVSV